MNVIDIRLDDSMKVVGLIPVQSQRQSDEFDYPDFPYICYSICLQEFMGRTVHLHWHTGLHFIEVLSGRIRLRSGTGVQLLEPGTVCFVNVNVLHGLEAEDPPEQCVFRGYVFQPDLLCGNWETTLAAKYVRPILGNPDINMIAFDPETSAAFREMLAQTRRAHAEKKFGYEFEIRHQISLIWLLLLNSLTTQLRDTNPVDAHLKQRIRTMLSFIRTNYMHKIDLDDIAESALISQRECFRCFKKTLGVTPNHYLQNFRVRVAARMLLESDEPVNDIALSCGFSDTSYFGKTFQKYMGCSPSEYRRNHQKDYTPFVPPQ